MTKSQQKAAAELHRLAQATALLRLFRESEGRPARRRQLRGKIQPTREDYAAAEREHPDLVRAAHEPSEG